MATELATAYISLVPSARGLKKAIEKEMAKAAGGATGAGAEAGDEFSKGFADSSVKRISEAGAEAGAEFADEFAGATRGGDLGKAMDRIVDTAETTGKEAGEELADGIGAGAEDAALTADRNLDSGGSRIVSTGRSIGDQTGARLSDALDGSTVDVGADLDNRFRSNTASLEERGRIVGRETGDAATAGVDAAGTQIGEGLSNRFRANTSDMPARGRDIGDETGGEIGDGIVDGLPDISGGLGGALGAALGGLPAAAAGPALAAGAAVGALVVSGFGDALANEQLNDTLSARLAVSDAQAGRFARVTADVYRNAWGESTADVADAIDNVYSTLDDSKRSEEALQGLTEKALTFAEVMDQDLGQAVSNAGVLIETGLAADADEAFDLMTAGAQRVPAAIRDELAEATQEYSVFFADLGFSGDEAFGLLVEAADGGRFALDKTGDAIKEFSIRASDLDDTGAVEALDALGFSAEEASGRLLAGGDTAREATQEIIGALAAVEDPSEQAALAVALLGAPIEDLSKAQIPEFLRRMADSTTALEDVEGAADDLTDAYGNMATNIETVKRALLGGSEDFANDILAPLAALLEEDSTWENVGAGIMAAIGRGVELNPIPNAVRDAIEEWRGFIFGESEEGPARNPVGEFIAETNIAASEATPVMAGWERVQIDVADASERLATEQSKAGEAIVLSSEFAELAAERYSNLLDNLSNVSPLDNIVGQNLDLKDSLEDLSETIDGLPRNFDVISATRLGTDIPEDVSAALRGVISTADEARESIALAFELGGADKAREKAGLIRAEFVDVFAEAKLTDDQIVDLLDLAGLSEQQIDIALNLTNEEEIRQRLSLLNEAELEIPEQLSSFINLQALAGEFDAVDGLIDAFVEDMSDGRLDNPILLAIIDDPAPLDAGVEGKRREIEGASPALVPVGADTDLATEDMFIWSAGVFNQKTDTKVGADTAPARSDVDQFGIELAGRTPYEVKVRAVFPTGSIFGNLPGAENSQLPGIATGGIIEGPGTGTSDSILARLSDGEYVIKAKSVNSLGVGALDAINKTGRLPAFATGGMVGSVAQAEMPDGPGAGGPRYEYTVVEAQKVPKPEDAFRVWESEEFLAGFNR